MATEWANRCKITVLKREYYDDLVETYLENPNVGRCAKFEDGQEFIVDKAGYLSMLGGTFCSEAWDCINKYVYAAMQGGAIMKHWTKDDGVMIASCNDGVRPVIFKLERIE